VPRGEKGGVWGGVGGGHYDHLRSSHTLEAMTMDESMMDHLSIHTP
jgi:hypothetical protein